MAARRIPPGGIRGTIYRELARLRLKDAICLLGKERYNGCIYLAGYAIECHLKFAICERKEHDYLPAQLEVHDWDRLVTAAGLLVDIKKQKRMAGVYFSLVEHWGTTLRYRTTMYRANQAEGLFKQMNELYVFFKELVP
jgi:hypothetical protein